MYKAFGSLQVLEDVSFSVRAGEAFCILGRSGTRKSVRLKQLIGLIPPDQGRIYIEEEEITSLPPREPAKIEGRLCDPAKLIGETDEEGRILTFWRFFSSLLGGAILIAVIYGCQRCARPERSRQPVPWRKKPEITLTVS